MCYYTLSSCLPLLPRPRTACATAMYNMPHRARRLVSLLPHLYGLEGLLYGNPLQRRRAACTLQQHLRGHATEIESIVRGARFRFLENATRARARLLRGWPGERSS